MITAVVLDNGDPDFERCLQSLHDQTIEVDVLVVAGPKTDISLAREYGTVIGPIKGFLNARLCGLSRAVKEGAAVVLSCDSDTVYHHEYAEAAYECLQKYPVALAGTVIPKKDSVQGRLEIELIYKLLRFPYEHILALSDVAVNAISRTVEFRYSREDISMYLLLRAIPYTVCKNMIAWVDVPTYHFKKFLQGDFDVLIRAVSGMLS